MCGGAGEDGVEVSNAYPLKASMKHVLVIVL